jgi:hypothetical protein
MTWKFVYLWWLRRRLRKLEEERCAIEARLAELEELKRLWCSVDVNRAPRESND